MALILSPKGARGRRARKRAVVACARSVNVCLIIDLLWPRLSIAVAEKKVKTDLYRHYYRHALNCTSFMNAPYCF